MTPPTARFDVGGVILERPFKIRRLGHFGINVEGTERSLAFYRDLLGFMVSDRLDFAHVLPPAMLEGLADPTDTVGYFTRYGTDHHAFVLFPKQVMDMVAPGAPEVTSNQITWQVGSLREVHDAIEYLAELGINVVRTGRDVPGSNWHVYFHDPDGHTIELFYGIEQVGWDGRSKPKALYRRGFHKLPELPQMSEHAEVDEAAARGKDLFDGYRDEPALPEEHDVDGILLARPFKAVRLGPVAVFCADVEKSLAFYRDVLGFVPTEEVEYGARRCIYLRTNTEHHSLALLPKELRAELGLGSHTTTAWLGLELATYRQLCHAVDFLRARGVPFVEAPTELAPGIEFAAWCQDPAGHAVMLYFGMEQVGWDGRPRPAELRRPQGAPWPEAMEATSDTYCGEPFMGPWG